MQGRTGRGVFSRLGLAYAICELPVEKFHTPDRRERVNLGGFQLNEAHLCSLLNWAPQDRLALHSFPSDEPGGGVSAPGGCGDHPA